MIPAWVGIATLVVGAGLTVSALVTGKAMNPIRGLSPFLVTRDREPFRYWASVELNLFVVLVGCVLLRSAFSN
jgi:hypothetical protein